MHHIVLLGPLCPLPQHLKVTYLAPIFLELYQHLPRGICVLRKKRCQKRRRRSKSHSTKFLELTSLNLLLITSNPSDASYSRYLKTFPYSDWFGVCPRRKMKQQRKRMFRKCSNTTSSQEYVSNASQPCES